MHHTLRAAAFAVLSALAVAAPAPAQPSTESGRAGAAPSGLGAAVERDLARSRSATERFKALDVAKAAGYVQNSECVEHQPHGAMGYHFGNDALLDTTLDPERPEVLVYERMADGTFKLNGVEHLVPIAAWNRPEPPMVMGQPLKRADRLGIWYLHVWTFTPSPSGMFADWNPLVKCEPK